MMKLSHSIFVLLLCHGATGGSLRGLMIRIKKPCNINFDCPQIPCTDSNCQRNYCEDGFCVLPVPVPSDNNDEGTEDREGEVEDNSLSFPCETNADCPVIMCFAPPCEIVCENGFCSVPSTDTEDRFDDPPEDNIDDSGNSTSTTTPCGDNECSENETCCNFSCGICIDKDGGVCEDKYCLPDDGNDSDETDPIDSEEPIECGPVTCSLGEVCCNKSCGVCTAPFGSCTKEFCQQNNDKEEDNAFAVVTRGDCDCDSQQCSVCRKILGFCLKLNC